jgi:CubicO group peptidase (beta-lactamase class C family)
MAITSWAARHGMTSSQYQSTFDDFVRKGYRLRDVSGYEDNNSARYAAIWEKSSGPTWVARHGLNSSAYQATFDDYVRQGYRLVHVSGYGVRGNAHFAAIWEKSSGSAWQARHGMTSQAYQSTFNDLVRQGYWLRCVSGYNQGGQTRYAAIWDKSSGPPWVARHGLTSTAYQVAFDDLLREGYRLVHVSGYPAGGQSHYAAIWEKSSGPVWVARHGLSSSGYQAAFDEWFYQGFRLKQVSGYGIGDDRYAAIWENAGFQWSELEAMKQVLEEFMGKYSIPGISVAIAKDGRGVYARALGQANTSTNEALTVKHRFRLASISKPITATGIMKLMEQGRLRLGDKVIGSGSLLGTTYGNTPYGTGITDITVQELLEHTSGGWPNDSNDPMFKDKNWSHQTLIDWTLNNDPLDNTPGTNWNYSNFGYCLLGRVIEAVTGRDYDDWMKMNILGPSGAKSMELGGNTLAERKPNEVIYYGQDGQNPYNMNVTRMDSHGGWISTAIDLVRFGLHVDGLGSDVISNSSRNTMLTPSAVYDGYAKGWSVNSVPNWWHGGSLPGTRTIFVRTTSGFTWAALCNSRSTNNSMGGDLDKMMWDLVGKVGTWPDHDLF